MGPTSLKEGRRREGGEGMGGKGKQRRGGERGGTSPDVFPRCQSAR